MIQSPNVGNQIGQKMVMEPARKYVLAHGYQLGQRHCNCRNQNIVSVPYGTPFRPYSLTFYPDGMEE